MVTGGTGREAKKAEKNCRDGNSADIR